MLFGNNQPHASVECSVAQGRNSDTFVKMKYVGRHAQPCTRADVEVGGREVVAMRTKVDGVVRFGVKLLAQFTDDWTQIRVTSRAIDVAHRGVDQPRVTVIMVRMKRQPARQQEHLRWDGIYAFIPV